jgi:hypothetical protein
VLHARAEMVRQGSVPRTSGSLSSVFGAGAVVVVLAACTGQAQQGGPAGDAQASAVGQAAAVSSVASIAASASSAASPSAPSSAASEPLASRPLPLLLAGVPAPGVRLTERRTLNERGGTGRATIGVPEGWHAHGANNGMSDDGATVVVVLNAPDKTAVVLLAAHGTHFESCLDYGAGAWLAQSGGVYDQKFEPAPVAGELGERRLPVLLLRGRGTLGHSPVDLYQVRHLFRYSPASGDAAHLVLGAIRKDAPPERFAELVAAMASFEPTLPDNFDPPAGSAPNVGPSASGLAGPDGAAPPP